MATFFFLVPSTFLQEPITSLYKIQRPNLAQIRLSRQIVWEGTKTKLAQIALGRIGDWSGKDCLFFLFGPNYFPIGPHCQPVQKAKAQISQNTTLKKNSPGGGT